MDALTIGDPWDLATDVGPVIDRDAFEQIDAYCRAKENEGRLIKRCSTETTRLFVPPTMLRVGGIEEMEREIFGPVLHVASFEGGSIRDAVRSVNAKGYGLTFGLHTRIDRRVQRVLDSVNAGNVYVNRDQIGAIVGSQPFGGHGLSGTGPKAGGPHYLPRFRQCAEAEPLPETGSGATVDPATLTKALGALDAEAWQTAPDRIQTLRAVLRGRASEAVVAASALDFGPVDLPGPTGESNQFFLGPRGAVLCLGPDPDALLAQSVQALAAGNAVLAIAPDAPEQLSELSKTGRVPLAALDGVCTAAALERLPVQAVAFAGTLEDRRSIRRTLAERDGPILPLITDRISPIAYCTERTVCIDTTAAGGNATLLAKAGS
jgi:RHH-type proline utilization regulon transcriptional repressor/proline dehydrogenase/delta 1-pyrroline-5-carboxylate dehydrogenase